MLARNQTYGDTDTYGECRDSHESRSDEVTVGMAHCVRSRDSHESRSDEVTVGMAHCVRSRKEDFSCCRNRSAIGVKD